MGSAYQCHSRKEEKKTARPIGCCRLLGRERESRTREEEKELGRARKMDAQGTKPGWAARAKIKRGREEK